MGIGDDQLDAVEAAGLQRPQERRPEGAVLAAQDLDQVIVMSLLV
jgi:hypothetical protein